jgi:hypothetical protein
MKRRPQGPKARPKGSRGKKRGTPVRAGTQLEKVFALIRAGPGIRPSEINRRLKLAQSDATRAPKIEFKATADG